MGLLSKHENFENEGTITMFISETFTESTASQTVQLSPIYKLQACFMPWACTQQSVINMSNGTKMYR